MRLILKVGLVLFLLVVCCFHRQLREGFAALKEMNLQLSKMVGQRGLEVDQQTLPYQAICARLPSGKGQCKPPYECKTPSELQYGNCL